MRLALALFLAGCGRFGFDDRPDAAEPDATPDTAPIGHDEDGDGLGDATDPCPHIPGSAGDTDGDGVGDACDPAPSGGGDRLRRFWSLQPGDHPFTDLSQLVQMPDGLRFSGTTIGLIIPAPFANARFEVGFEIHAQVGTGQHQIATGVVGTNPYYFVELNENLGAKNLSITSYDATNGYVNHDLVQTPGGVHPGVGLLRFDASTAPEEITSTAGWVGELYNAFAPAPGFTGGTDLNLVLNGLDVTLHYVVIIDHGP